MKNLWTPWRMDYILGDKAPGCIFDKAPDRTYDPGHLLLYRDLNSVVLLNRFPYTNGHLLIAPSRHIACLTELGEIESSDLMETVKRATAILRKILNPDGFNIGLNIGEAAGAGLADHLHFHIIPRWQGDHNFMTPLAEIRTIPEHIEKTFKRFLPDFQKLVKAKTGES